MKYEKAHAEITMFDSQDIFMIISKGGWCNAYGETDFDVRYFIKHTCYQVTDANNYNEEIRAHLYNCYDVSPELTGISTLIACRSFTIVSDYVQ